MYEDDMPECIAGIPLEEYRLILAKLDARRALEWLTHVREGTMIIYHEGLLAVDRRTNSTADLVGKLFSMAAERNLVQLSQVRKIEEDEEEKPHVVYIYRARRTAIFVSPKARKRFDRLLKGAKA